MKEAVILLVEDNEMDVELTLDAFEHAGLTNKVQVVRNGEQALDYLMGRGEYADRVQFPMPDLVLLDLHLPGMSGQEVLTDLKTRPGLKRLPIVILTSSKQDADRLESYDNGANSFLVKPVGFMNFVEVARTVGDYWLTLNVAPPTLESSGHQPPDIRSHDDTP
ncbi:MAG: response regulator [Deltaproteobacteria bacterium]|nr:response regulator [Deltaproteobacteria bacterium]